MDVTQVTSVWIEGEMYRLDGSKHENIFIIENYLEILKPEYWDVRFVGIIRYGDYC